MSETNCLWGFHLCTSFPAKALLGSRVFTACLINLALCPPRPQGLKFQIFIALFIKTSLMGGGLCQPWAQTFPKRPFFKYLPYLSDFKQNYPLNSNVVAFKTKFIKVRLMITSGDRISVISYYSICFKYTWAPSKAICSSMSNPKKWIQ